MLRQSAVLDPQRWMGERGVLSRATVAAVLLAIGGCAPSGDSTLPSIGLVQVASVVSLDETRQAFLQVLADSGFVPDSTITLVDRNAQGDIATLTLILNEFKQRDVDYVASISSVATQAALKAVTDRPIVFGAVSNPYIIGAGTSPTDHRPNVTGAPVPIPVDSALVLAHEAFPSITTWGTLFDPADPFAEYYLEMANRAAEAVGVRFLTVACTSPNEIVAGIQALHAQGAGGLLQIPSVSISGGFSAVVKATRQIGIPLVATLTDYPGVPLASGLNFTENGRSMGLLMVRVLRGEDPATIPFDVGTPRRIIVDLDAAREFGLILPESIIGRADSVLGQR